MVTPAVEQNAELAKISLRFPPFMKSNAELWFHQVDSQFIAMGISSDKTKFHYVVGILEEEILIQVADIVQNPPIEGKFKKLKDRLISYYGMSDERKMKYLLTEIELGDMKPSALLRKMQCSAPSYISTELLKVLWIQHLPVQLQSFLRASDDKSDLPALSALADKLHETINVSEMSALDKQDVPSASLTSLEKKVCELTEIINELSSKTHRETDRRRLFRSPTVSSDKYCWYHSNFGNKARKCISPCQYLSRFSKNVKDGH